MKIGIEALEQLIEHGQIFRVLQDKKVTSYYHWSLQLNVLAESKHAVILPAKKDSSAISCYIITMCYTLCQLSQ